MSDNLHILFDKATAICRKKWGKGKPWKIELRYFEGSPYTCVVAYNEKTDEALCSTIKIGEVDLVKALQLFIKEKN